METAGMSRWLLTYADMITLLLALFIILFSISTINKVKLQRLVRDLGGGFNNVDALNNPPNGQTTVTKDELKVMQSQLQQYISQNQLQNKVQTRIRQNGTRRELVITLLTDKSLYDSGSAELRDVTKGILDVVNGQLRIRKNDIRVEGNTDNVPIHTAQFPSNWELSAARAVGVARYLVEHDGLSPKRIQVAGYGEFRPRVPNDTEEHRQANRRVDVVVLDTQEGGTSAAAVRDEESTGEGEAPVAAAGEGQPKTNPAAKSEGETKTKPAAPVKESK
jgi:chemotaxis protein MotB